MEKLNNIEKAILLHLMKQKKRMTVSHSILSVEKLETKFTRQDIVAEAKKLRDKGIIILYLAPLDNGANGHIANPTALKELKETFKCELCFYKIQLWLKQVWLFIWKHFLITIIASALTTLLTLFLTGYLKKEEGSITTECKQPHSLKIAPFHYTNATTKPLF